MNKLVLLACVYFSLVLCNEYYSWDGSNNNLANPTWGQQGSQLTRDYPTLPYNYEDGISQPVNGPNARVISNTLMSVAPANPYSHVGVNDLHTTWGYFMAHDISRTLGSSEATPIPVPYSDPYWNPLGLNSSVLPQSKISISFTRKKGSPSNATMPRNQYYASTPYLDLQTFYGMNASYNYAFRLKSDTQRGRLKTSAGNNLPFDPLGNGLPASFNQAALGSNKTAFCGDTIIHSYPTSVGIATIFLREHNRLADQFAAAHPEWTDDQVFNEARRWLIAIYQSITYNEYIPATTSLPPPKYEGYNATVMPGVQALWLGATVRYGHTEINSVVHALDENWNQHPLGDVLVRDYWRLTSTLIGKYTTVDPIIRGALMSHQQEVDLYYTDEMRVYTLGYPGRGGTDAGSATVQRGRDYGLPYFNDVRAAFGLEPKETWAEITSNPTIASLLESLYNTTDKLDFFVGALAEDHPGLHMGETFTAAFNNQLMRSIHTDRLFYKSPYANFTAAEIAEIENTKLSTLILRNFPEIPSVQCSAFYVSKVKDCGVQPNITCDTNENPNTVSLFEGNVKASWTLNAAEDAVTVTVVANTTGWVAFGFAKEAGRMIGADIVAGWVDDASSTSHVYDMTANAKQECSAGTGVCADSDIGGTDDLSYKLATQANGMTTLTFTRKLVTGDALDMPLAVNTDIAIVAAFGTSDGPLYYHGQNKVAATIRLVGSSSTTTTTSGSTSTTGQAVESTTGDGANLSGVERSAYSLLLVIVAFALYMF